MLQVGVAAGFFTGGGKENGFCFFIYSENIIYIIRSVGNWLQCFILDGKQVELFPPVFLGSNNYLIAILRDLRIIIINIGCAFFGVESFPVV